MFHLRLPKNIPTILPTEKMYFSIFRKNIVNSSDSFAKRKLELRLFGRHDNKSRQFVILNNIFNLEDVYLPYFKSKIYP